MLCRENTKLEGSANQNGVKDISSLSDFSVLTEWTEEEDVKLFKLYKEKGSVWSVIAKDFKGRTENNIKNRFYSTLRRIARKKAKESFSETFINKCKQNLLNYIDDAIEYGHHCFNKRGRPRKSHNKLAKRSTHSILLKTSSSNGSNAACNKGNPLSLFKVSSNYSFQVDVKEPVLKLGLNQAMVNLVRAQQALINTLLSKELLQSKSSCPISQQST